MMVSIHLDGEIIWAPPLLDEFPLRFGGLSAFFGHPAREHVRGGSSASNYPTSIRAGLG